MMVGAVPGRKSLFWWHSTGEVGNEPAQVSLCRLHASKVQRERRTLGENTGTGVHFIPKLVYRY